MAARYRAAETMTRVGGDWYDALELPSRRLGLVIGDVVGHGVRAAALMGELRSGLRAFASEGRSPADTLARLEAFAVATHGVGMLATALFLVLDLDTGRATCASAGHPPPLLLLPDGSARYCEITASAPLGLGHPDGFASATVAVPDGATLVLFSDGLVERRGEVIDEGLERLVDAIGDVRPLADPDELCTRIISRIEAGGAAGDDIALLVARVDPLPLDGWSVRLPATVDSVPLARHRVTGWLDRLEVPAECRFALALAVTEAASNVVEHAYGPGAHDFEVAARRDREAVVVWVTDRGRWRAPRETPGRGRGLHIIEEIADEVDVVPTAGGTTVRIRQRLARPAAARPRRAPRPAAAD